MNGDYFSLLKAGSPYRLPADIWSDNPVQWPEIKYPDIMIM